VHDQRRRRGNTLRRQQLGEVHLVGAAEDGIGLIEDGEPLGLGPAGEAVGVVIDPGGLADEEGIELAHPGEVVAGDHLDREALTLAGATNRSRARRFDGGVASSGSLRIARSWVNRAGRLRWYERREKYSRAASPTNARWSDWTSLRERARTDRRSHSASVRMSRARRSGAWKVRKSPCQAVVLLGQVAAEVDGEDELVALQPGQAPADEAVELVADHPRETRDAQVLDGLHAGQHAVAPRLGEQRYVVAAGAVAVVGTEVDDVDRFPAQPFAGREVLAGADDRNIRQVEGESGYRRHHDLLQAYRPPRGSGLRGGAYRGPDRCRRSRRPPEGWWVRR
jgi:hypothetical protein